MEKPWIKSTSSFKGVPIERNLFACVGSIAQITDAHRFSHLSSTVSRKKRRSDVDGSETLSSRVSPVLLLEDLPAKNAKRRRRARLFRQTEELRWAHHGSGHVVLPTSNERRGGNVLERQRWRAQE